MFLHYRINVVKVLLDDYTKEEQKNKSLSGYSKEAQKYIENLAILQRI